MNRTIQHITIFKNGTAIVTYTDGTAESVRAINITIDKELNK